MQSTSTLILSLLRLKANAYEPIARRGAPEHAPYSCCNGPTYVRVCDEVQKMTPYSHLTLGS